MAVAAAAVAATVVDVEVAMEWSSMEWASALLQKVIVCDLESVAYVRRCS